MAIALDEWVRLLGREYLEDFIVSGGSAVKFAITPDDHDTSAMAAIKSEARSHGYFVATIDAGQTRVHMIDQIFHAVARLVPWEKLTDQWLRNLLRTNGIEVSEDKSLRDLDQLAEANKREKLDLLREIKSLITTASLYNYAMSKEFRAAVATLGYGAFAPPSSDQGDTDVIRQWLFGEKCGLASLKRIGIFQRISRHNARILLRSLAVWLHEVGCAGMVLILDLRPALAAEQPAESVVRYSRNSLLDLYEVLRQFIDDTDEIAHVLIVAIASPGLIEGPKSVENYDALKLRIADEVRDRDRANPLNALVRLNSSYSEGGVSG